MYANISKYDTLGCGPSGYTWRLTWKSTNATHVTLDRTVPASKRLYSGSLGTNTVFACATGGAYFKATATGPGGTVSDVDGGDGALG